MRSGLRATAMAVLVGCGSTSTQANGGPPDATADDTGGGAMDATTHDGAPSSDAATEAEAAAPDAGLDPPIPCTATCDAGDGCFENICCPPPTPSGAFTLPTATSYVHWTLGAAASSLSISLRIHNDPGTAEGLYLSLGGGSIDKTGWYFGVQTNLYQPNVGPVGKGFIFSEFGYADASYVRAGPGGFTQVDTTEGPFAGVRLKYAWTPGDYVVTLARAEALGESDWYDFSVTPNQGSKVYVGGVRFPRATMGVPATIGPALPAFHEVYSGTADYSGVPRWHVSMTMSGDGQPATTATTEYPTAWPNEPKFPNVDVWYDAPTTRVHVVAGGLTPKCHAAGLLF